MKSIEISTYGDPVKLAFNHIREGVMIIDKRVHLLEINPVGLKIFGLKEGDIFYGTKPFECCKVFDDHYKEIPAEPGGFVFSGYPACSVFLTCDKTPFTK